jgi:membrane-bound ClpP family serine protease
VSTLGVVLLLAGVALAAAEAHVPSHGALGGSAAVATAGGIALVIGGAGFGLAAALAAGLVAGLVAMIYVWVVLQKALGASRRRVRSGAEGLIGRVGEVWGETAPPWQGFFACALLRARLWTGDEERLHRGDPIVVERVDGLTLTVRRAEEWEVAP